MLSTVTNSYLIYLIIKTIPVNATHEAKILDVTVDTLN